MAELCDPHDWLNLLAFAEGASQIFVPAAHDGIWGFSPFVCVSVVQHFVQHETGTSLRATDSNIKAAK